MNILTSDGGDDVVSRICARWDRIYQEGVVDRVESEVIPANESLSDIIRRLTIEKDNLVGSLRDGQEMSVGDSEQFVICKSFAEEHQVSALARYTTKGEKVEIHASPLNYKKDTKWKMGDSSLVETEEVAEKSDIAWPVTSVEKDFFNEVEMKLFEEVNRLNPKVVLINPSRGSVWRALRFGWAVCFEGAYDRKWFYDECNFSNVPVISNPEKYLMYLGSNGYRRHREGKYFSLVASPYSKNFPFSARELKWTETSIEMRYTRKGREVFTAIYFDEMTTCPHDLQSFLRMDRAEFFLQSNYIEIPHAMDTSTNIMGYFDTAPPTYVGGISQDATHVWDVAVLGTSWLQRQAKVRSYAASVKKKPKPLLRVGKFQVSFGSQIMEVPGLVPEVFEGGQYYCRETRFIKRGEPPDGAHSQRVYGKELTGKRLRAMPWIYSDRVWRRGRDIWIPVGVTGAIFEGSSSHVVDMYFRVFDSLPKYSSSVFEKKKFVDVDDIVDDARVHVSSIRSLGIEVTPYAVIKHISPKNLVPWLISTGVLLVREDKGKIFVSHVESLTDELISEGKAKKITDLFRVFMQHGDVKLDSIAGDSFECLLVLLHKPFKRMVYDTYVVYRLPVIVYDPGTQGGDGRKWAV